MPSCPPEANSWAGFSRHITHSGHIRFLNCKQRRFSIYSWLRVLVRTFFRSISFSILTPGILLGVARSKVSIDSTLHHMSAPAVRRRLKVLRACRFV
jgi:hypothetical protein